jgi:hypothetical protein
MKSTRPAPNLLGGQTRKIEDMLKTRRKKAKNNPKMYKNNLFWSIKSIHKTEQNDR